MARATVTTNKGKFYCWLVFCPGCECVHGPNAGWTFNGDFEKPTFSPSILVKGADGDGAKTVCHSFVRDGQIQFLGDCTHELAGKTVDLPDEFNNDFNTADYVEQAEKLNFRK